MSNKLTRNETLTLCIAGVTGIVSVVAIVISLRSNHLSSQALELSQRSYVDDRRILLRTERIEDKSYGLLRFVPLESNAQVSSMTVFFPTRFKIAPITVVPPELELAETLIAQETKAYLDSMTPKHEGFASLRPHHPIQGYVIVHGYTKGTAVITAGVYDFYFEYLRLPDGGSKVKLRSAALNNYVQNVTDPQQYIDDLFSTIERRMAVTETQQSSGK